MKSQYFEDCKETQRQSETRFIHSFPRIFCLNNIRTNLMKNKVDEKTMPSFKITSKYSKLPTNTLEEIHQKEIGH